MSQSSSLTDLSGQLSPYVGPVQEEGLPRLSPDPVDLNRLGLERSATGELVLREEERYSDLLREILLSIIKESRPCKTGPKGTSSGGRGEKGHTTIVMGSEGDQGTGNSCDSEDPPLGQETQEVIHVQVPKGDSPSQDRSVKKPKKWTPSRLKRGLRRARQNGTMSMECWEAIAAHMNTAPPIQTDTNMEQGEQGLTQKCYRITENYSGTETSNDWNEDGTERVRLGGWERGSTSRPMAPSTIGDTFSDEDFPLTEEEVATMREPTSPSPPREMGPMTWTSSPQNGWLGKGKEHTGTTQTKGGKESTSPKRKTTTMREELISEATSPWLSNPSSPWTNEDAIVDGLSREFE